MNVNVSNCLKFICTILLVATAIIHGVNGQGEINRLAAGPSDGSIGDYLQGMNLTTPESDGIYPAMNLGESKTSMEKLASYDPLASNGDMSGVEWQTLLGSSSGDVLFDIQVLGDNEYIAVGSASWNDGSVTGDLKGYSDAWIVKLRDRTLDWQRVYGGNGYDQGMSIRPTKDGGFVFIGYSSSDFNEINATNHGLNDILVMKLDRSGNKTWQRLLGGSGNDYGYSIRQTTDEGYIIAGDTFSHDIPNVASDIEGTYAAKLDRDGNVVWQKVFGGSGTNSGSSIIAATDSGYILTGYSNSEDFGDPGERHGNTDIFVMKLDESGDQQWLKLFGGVGYELTGMDNTIAATKDGGYILTGHSNSYDSGDVGINHGCRDIWVVKLNRTGDLEWQKLYGGVECDIVGAISQVPDGGYIFTAHPSSSQSGDISEKNSGVRDVWVVRLDPSGNILWEQLIGGNDWDQSTSIRPTPDGGYIFAGFTRSSNSGYIGANHGYDDGWIVKLNPRLTVDVRDADTKEWVPNVTVTIHNINRNESRNLTALINGRVVFADTGVNHWLAAGGKYSVVATADNYRTSAPVTITYSGDGQRVIVNMTPLIANYTKSFSITCIENYDNMDPPLGSIDECNNIASNLIKAGYKMNFYHKDEDVIKENFAVDPSYTGDMLTESAFHYHSGHGTDPFNNSGMLFSTFLPLKNYAFHNITKGIGLVSPFDVKKKWGGKNKWVMLDACNVLRDDKWGDALTTTHGILGFTSVSWVRMNFGDTFFKYAFDKDETIVGAYKNATIALYQDDNITAKVITKSKDQMKYDQFPGVGHIEPDGDPNSTKNWRLNWNCRSGDEW